MSSVVCLVSAPNLEVDSQTLCHLRRTSRQYHKANNITLHVCLYVLITIVFRLYSHYLYFERAEYSAELFDELVDKCISTFYNCTTQRSVRECLYDNSMIDKMGVSQYRSTISHDNAG